MAKNDTVAHLFELKKNLLSFEVYPPKTADGVKNLLLHLSKLESFSPDFISVTYGAGGSTQERSLEVLEKVHLSSEAAVLAHFTCVGLDKNSIADFISHLKKLNIINILALRGDRPADRPDFDFSSNYFKYASELVSFLKASTDLCIGVAGYPEGHMEAPDREKDWDFLRTKVDAGAEFVITQLFFDTNDYFKFRDGMLKRGITIPLIPGILPVPSLEKLNKSINLSGCRVSDEFKSIAEKFRDDPGSFRQASLDYFINHIKKLLENNVPGIHYYILNSSEMVSEILDTLG